MALDKNTLISDLQAIFEDLDPNTTPAVKAQKMADAIEAFVKTGTIKIGSLSSNGVGNLGSPVSSSNTNTGVIE